jgi:hypothetical protein
MTQVVIDRTLCEGPLAKSGFIKGSEEGFGIFERWILRLGYFTSRREGPAACDGDLIIFLYPSGNVSRAFRQRVVDYVAGGGSILVVDSPTNGESTSNDLLRPFGIQIDASEPVNGTLESTFEAMPVPVREAALVQGGTALARVAGRVVGATTQYKQGQVAVIGFGSRFTDAEMGFNGDVIPDEHLRHVFDLQFSLLRALIQRGPAGAPD